MKEYNRVKEKEIESLILGQFRITKEELYSKNREALKVDARRTMMYLLRDRLGYTFQELGRVFNTHYSTAIHHIQVMDYLKNQSPIKEKYDLIKKELDFSPLVLTDNDSEYQQFALKRIMDSIVWEEKGTTRKNLERLLTTNFN